MAELRFKNVTDHDVPIPNVGVVAPGAVIPLAEQPASPDLINIEDPRASDWQPDPHAGDPSRERLAQEMNQDEVPNSMPLAEAQAIIADQQNPALGATPQVTTDTPATVDTTTPAQPTVATPPVQDTVQVPVQATPPAAGGNT